ncbi:hypothetical protein [Angustibacter aerolatus]
MQPRPALVIDWVESAVVLAGREGITLRGVQEYVWDRLPQSVRSTPDVLAVGANLSSALGSLKRANRIWWDAGSRRWFSVTVELDRLPFDVATT